jgi:SNF2 family DNA or RNA helicase
MKYEDRQMNIDQFNEDAEVSIFLLSTRAGGLVRFLAS